MALLTDLLSKNGASIPSNYIRPESERCNLFDVKIEHDSIPVIDLYDLIGPGRSEVVKTIGLACQNDGFFQVKNHGIPKRVMENMLQMAKEFFHLPDSERMLCYSNDSMKTTRLSTSFNVKMEKVGSWRDYLRLHCHPLEDYLHDWPSNPSNFKEVVGEYSKQVRGLVLKILEAISESLGLEGEYLNMALGKHGQHMAINYYPPCPQPELTLGLPPHKDPNAITVLLQNGVSGLQVMTRNGKWISVKPDPENFIVNIGDQMQVLSNGRYKSVLHRAIVNDNTERISIPTFYCPSFDAVIKPPQALVTKEKPALFKSYTYEEYYEKFWNVGLNSESCLDLFSIDHKM